MKLFLLIQHFFDPDSPERRLAVLEAYNFATTFITYIIEVDVRISLFAHIPVHLFRMLFTAAGAVFKVLNSSYSPDVDTELGNATLNQAISAMRKCSVENNDVAGRHAEIMRQLWLSTDTVSTPGCWQPPSLVHRSRFGASLAYDCLFYWRDNVGGQRSIGLNSSATSSYAPNSRCLLLVDRCILFREISLIIVLQSSNRIRRSVGGSFRGHRTCVELKCT